MARLQKEEINLLPEFEWDGEIIEIVTIQGALKAISLLSTEKVVGFDTETRPAFKKGEYYTPALLQLATKERAFLFRLKQFELPPELGDFLGDDRILKAGVGIRDDLIGLGKILSFEPKGFVDLSLEARKRGLAEEGLRPLTARVLGYRLLKGSKITNWERTDLSEGQLLYAAFDAVVGLLIYEKLCGA